MVERGGPGRGRIRQRLLDRAGLHLPEDLPVRALAVGPLERTYLLAPAPAPGAPLLVALHGAGGTGAGMAALTALHERGPAAGVAVAFPDGVGRVWNDQRGAPGLRRREGVDDVAFVAGLVDHLVSSGVADGRRIALAGISNGAMLAEHVARHGLLSVAAVVLVAGAGTARSRQARPVPARPTAVLLFAGTADPLVPYGGGPIGFGRRRGPDGGPGARRGVATGVEEVAADWVAANGIAAAPAVAEVGVPGDLPVIRTSWVAPGRPPVVLHRIEGGGHTWPGGAPYLPARVVGPVARLDATAILLAFLAGRW